MRGGEGTNEITRHVVAHAVVFRKKSVKTLHSILDWFKNPHVFYTGVKYGTGFFTLDFSSFIQGPVLWSRCLHYHPMHMFCDWITFKMLQFSNYWMWIYGQFGSNLVTSMLETLTYTDISSCTPTWINLKCFQYNFFLLSW